MYCPHCGKSIEEKDSGGFGYGALGFFFPFIGLILFLVLRETKPKTAKAAGVGALIPVILIIGYTFLTEFPNFFEDLLGGLAFLLLGLSGFGG